MAQTKAIEVNTEGNMRFYGGSAVGTNSSDIRFGDNQEWGVEYYNKGLNFFKPNESAGDGKVFFSDAGNVGIGTLDPRSKLHVNGGIECNIFTYRGNEGGNDDFFISSYNVINGSTITPYSRLYPVGDASLTIGFPTKRVQVYASYVSSAQFYTTSDVRTKENITKINSPISRLSKLNGAKYDIKKEYRPESERGKKKSIFDNNIGFLAQDLEKVFPELVNIDDSTGLYSINYIGLIPVLVEALKEQQSQITALTVKEQSNAQLMLRMEQLEKQLAQCCPANTAPGKGKLKSSPVDAETTTEATATSTSAGIVLYQNSPNPFSTSTEISMELPKDVQDAQLTVYNLAGEQRLSIAVTDRGAAKVRIEAGQLKPGIYIYGIIADGQLAASKQMVVTE